MLDFTPTGMVMSADRPFGSVRVKLPHPAAREKSDPAIQQRSDAERAVMTNPPTTQLAGAPRHVILLHLAATRKALPL